MEATEERKQDAAISEYWCWFAANIKQIQRGDPVVDIALENQVRRLSDRIGIEFSRVAGQFELVFTAHGEAELFPLIKAIVASAPVMPGCQIVALKPAGGFDFCFQSGDVQLSAEDLWFLPLESSQLPGKLGLRVGSPCVPGVGGEDLLDIVNLILQTGMGEEAFAQWIWHVETSHLPENPKALGYIELPELPAYLSWFTSKYQMYLGSCGPRV